MSVKYTGRYKKKSVKYTDRLEISVIYAGRYKKCRLNIQVGIKEFG